LSPRPSGDELWPNKFSATKLVLAHIPLQPALDSLYWPILFSPFPSQSTCSQVNLWALYRLIVFICFHTDPPPGVEQNPEPKSTKPPPEVEQNPEPESAMKKAASPKPAAR